VDTTNGKLSAMTYNESAKQLETMPKSTLRRSSLAAPKRFSTVAPETETPAAARLAPTTDRTAVEDGERR